MYTVKARMKGHKEPWVVLIKGATRKACDAKLEHFIGAIAWWTIETHDGKLVNAGIGRIG